VLNRKWTSSILSTSSPTGSTREYLARGASSGTSSTLFDYLNNYTTTFVVDMVQHEGFSSTTSSSTCVRLEGLPRLPRQRQHRLGRHRLPTSSSAPTARRRQDSGSWGFVVYLVNIDFRLHLRHLLHRHQLGCGSRSFIVYLTDADSSIVFINTYFVACTAQDQGLHHNHRTRGASGIGMSGVTPKHEVLPGDRDRRGRGG
jgi:hypothetical protein